MSPSTSKISEQTVAEKRAQVARFIPAELSGESTQIDAHPTILKLISIIHGLENVMQESREYGATLELEFGSRDALRAEIARLTYNLAELNDDEAEPLASEKRIKKDALEKIEATFGADLQAEMERDRIIKAVEAVLAAASFK